MMQTFAGFGLVALLATSTFAQSPAPAFEAVDVHLHPRSTNPSPGVTGGVIRGGRYDLRNATMVDLIRTAYGIEADAVVGGPNWLERDRFDIAAKAAEGTSPDNLKVMLQGVLADRFKLVVHKDTRPMAGYALTLGKTKHKLKETSGQGKGCQGQQQPQDPNTVPQNVVSCHNMTSAELAQALRNMAGGYLASPVTDLTGLTGSWDFDLKWTARVLLPRAGADGITIFDAVENQLGLKLDQQKVPTPVLIVDSVNQRPTDDLAEVVKNIPAAPPAEFEVAEIKLSPPDTGTNIRLLPGGRIDAQGVTMKLMVTLAWDINLDEMLVGAPKWMDETKYTLTAKASSAVGGTAAQPRVDIDDIRMMVRALLKDRFKLATHMEERPVTAYTLLADKPKLQKADPSNRTGWKEGPAPDSKDPRSSTSTLTRLVTARNMTMAQFAEDLQRMANGYIRVPVENATRLEGAYDFTINFTPIGLLNGAGPGGRGAEPPAGGGAAAASDPTGGLSLFDAVNRQLGLKLEMRKRPMPVLVIDHIEEKPTDN
jgi:uncharacterized protein (TIGR03435 family)